MSKPIAYLFPCAVMSNFVGEKLNDSSTEIIDEWSRNNAELAITNEYSIYKTDKRSLKLVYQTTAIRKAVKGKSGETWTKYTWNNPFTDSPSDITDYTNVGAWIYPTEHGYSVVGNTNDLLTFRLEAALTNAQAHWNSSVVEDKWCWTDNIINLAAMGDLETLELYIKDTSGLGTDNGILYINDICLIKRKCSGVACPNDSIDTGTTAATGEYNWTNGIHFFPLKLTPTLTSYKVTGKFTGPNCVNLAEQLLQMQTTGLREHQIVERPLPKYDSIMDYGRVKTYLFYMKKTHSDGTFEYTVEPVVITEVAIPHKPANTESIDFTCTLKKYGGVI